MTDTELHEFLINFSFPYPEVGDLAGLEDGVGKVDNGLFEFLKKLGYNTDKIFKMITLSASFPENSDPYLSDEFVADYLVGQSPASTPYIIAEASLGMPDEIDHQRNAIFAKGALENYPDYFPALNFGFFLIFTNQYLVIATADRGIKAYLHEELSKEDVAEIQELLAPPKLFSERPVHPSAYHPAQTKLYEFEVPPFPATLRSTNVINEEQFNLDLADFSELLWKANREETPNEKGKSLEHIAEILFDAISCVSVRDTRVSTRPGEIDLIVERTGSKRLTIFDYYGRFIPVECKNWMDPVPVSEVGNFESTLVRTDTNLGVLFAWSGISGEDQDNHAQRLVDNRSPERPTIIVVDERDLYRIAQGKSFYDILDEKLYQRRFDLP